MRGKISVLVCDDHEVFREGVKSVLSRHPDIDVIGEAGDGNEAVDLARRLGPDVILMDISMPGLRGPDAAALIKKTCPRTQVVIVSIYNDEDLVVRCLGAGASGYVVKDAPASQIVYAIRSVAKGEQYLSPKLIKGIVGPRLKPPQRAGFRTTYDLLTNREREILIFLTDGYSLKEVASRLNLSVKTVDTHKYNIMRKLDIHDRVGLIRYALRKKLIDL